MTVKYRKKFSGINMADMFSVKERSKMMSKIRSKDTKFECLARKWLFSKGFRYRKNVKNLAGKPDIVFIRKKIAIFINGCFWHGHDGCKYNRIPKSNVEYWEKKITSNDMRDKVNRKVLEEQGWMVIVVWECSLKANFQVVMEELSEKINLKKLSKTILKNP